MQSIFVEPSRLEDVAGKIQTANDDYERLYRNLYSEVDKMSAAWSGKDNTMFVSQIRSYEHDFNQISIVMKQYIEFLRNSARAYRDTQDELYNQASRLSV